MTIKEAAIFLDKPLWTLYDERRYSTYLLPNSRIDLTPEQWRALYPVGMHAIAHCGQWHVIQRLPVICPTCGACILGAQIETVPDS
jgi:hypothetical protein